MSGVLDSYIETVEELLRAIEECKDNDKMSTDIEEAEDTISQMKIEIHSVGDKKKKEEYIAKINQFNSTIAKHKKALLTGKSNSANNGGTVQQAGAEALQRQQNSLDVLRKANQQLADTEQVGVDTLQNLEKQRETIARARENLKQTSDNLGYSNKMLNRMSKWWRG